MRPGTHSPLSFRQLLLIAFLGILLLMGGALMRTLVAVETLTDANRDSPRQALETVQSVRRLQDLTVTLEREARQYLVLNDPALQRELRTTWDQAQQVAGVLGARFPQPLEPLTRDWQAGAAQVLTPLLAGTPLTQSALSNAFTRLGTLNQQIDSESRAELAQRNQALMADFEQQRRSVIWIGIAAVTVAAILALVLGMWLARAYKQLDRAIDTLGLPGQHVPIAIAGPGDLHALGERLEILRQRLAALEADKLLFLRHISHELKTPLANLREGIALLEDQVAGHLNASQREILGILRDNAIALQQQIEGLLQYNAVAFDARRLQRRPVALRTLLENLVNRQRLQWQNRQLQVTVEGPALSASIDPEKIDIAVSNLLSNAIRFSPDGGTIRLVLQGTPQGWALDCIDSGPGVEAADRDRIFDPFFQGNRQPAGARKGSGIGLSIVRELVEAHGGQVTLEAQPVGAHFRMEVPHAEA